MLQAPLPQGRSRSDTYPVNMYFGIRLAQTLGVMKTSPRYRRIQTRLFAAHHMLLDAADNALEEAKKQEPGWFNLALSTITFSALAMEALGNAIGERVVPDWKDFESLSPYGKLRLLAQQLDVPYDARRKPWTMLRWLHKFRNRIAHPRPEVVKTQKLISEEERKKRPVDMPESSLEQEITLGNAENALAALQEIKALLCDKIPIEDRDGLSSDGWESSTDPHHAA